jgi:hypothetical protein
MKMNPLYVHHFESNAERKLFPHFEQADLPGATAFHSLNLPKHQKKQFSEADYVVVSSRGILVLEVKGGRISSKQGRWYTIDGDDHREPLKESPIVQVKDARIAIEDMLREKSLDIDLKKVNFGFGVMFPDVKLSDIGIELAKEEVFDALDWDRRNLGRWLEKLYKYWSERTGKHDRLSDHEVAVLCNALRGEFDREKALLAEVGDSWDQMIALTEQQYMAVDSVLKNKQIIFEGGAGTGKTLVAIKAAKILAGAGKRILFVCRSPVLTSFIRTELKDINASVMKFSTLKASPDAVPAFDCLIVDEGQDMLDMDSMAVIDGLFANGMNDGSWYFFMDPNNQGSLYADMDADAAEYLQSCGTSFPLTRNCRNTRQIAIHTMSYTGGDIGKCRVIGDGLPVLEKELDHDSGEHLVSLVESQLFEWIDDDGVKPGDITMLSPVDYEDSCVQQLDKRWRRKIAIINESFGERWLDTSITFSTIRDFKGLENKYVMLLDLDSLVAHPNAVNELYVAMTRANTVLWISVPTAARDWFNQLRAANAESLAKYVVESNL